MGVNAVPEVFAKEVTISLFLLGEGSLMDNTPGLDSRGSVIF